MDILIRGIKAEIDLVPLKQQLKEVIQSLSEQSGRLSLDNLEYVIVPEPDKFFSEVEAFQKSKGIREGCTNDSTFSAIAKVVSYEEDGRLLTTIFLDMEVLGYLFDEEMAPRGYHIIHHELCHVHDNFHLAQILGVDFLLKQSGNLETILKIHAVAPWSEYIATRLSITSIRNPDDIHASNFRQILDVTKDLINQEILKYRVYGDVKKLFFIVQEKVNALLNMAARYYGDLHGLQQHCSDYTELIDDIDESIRNTYFGVVWTLLGTELKKLWDKYPNWDGIQELTCMSDIVLQTWCLVGIEPKQTSAEIYVDVPFR